MKKPGANILVECLANQGTKKIFGVPGESYLSVINALIDYSSQIQWIGARQEGGASFMAAAYAQLTGKTGICFVTRAPGGYKCFNRNSYCISRLYSFDSIYRASFIKCKRKRGISRIRL